MSRLVVPLVLALSAVLCGVAGFVSADRKTEAPALGQDFRKLRDALDDAYELLQKDAGVKAVRIADDHTYLRRVYLDLTGAPPSPAEIAAFNPGGRDAERRSGQAKREALVEKLIESPEFAEHMASWWRVVMTEREGGARFNGMLEGYLRDAFTENRPWNEVVNGLIGAQGRTPGTPALGYLLTFQNDRAAMAGSVSRVFLGRQIQCAECHDHPYEADWGMDDFEAFAGFFRLFRTASQGEGAEQYWTNVDTPVRNETELQRRLRLSGKYKLPRFIGEGEYEFNAEKPLRAALADWVTSADNGWFREMTVNRYLDYLMGVGFVNPVDDFNSFNTATIPVVMEVMGADFAASGFDTRYLVRAITTSRMYQREVSPNRTNRNDRMFYSRQFVRSLTPEMVERSILKVMGVERLNRHGYVPDLPDRQLSGEQMQWKGTRERINAYRGYIRRQVALAFAGEPIVKDVDDHGGSILQALMFMNAELFPANLNHALKEILETYSSDNDRARMIYMTVLGRKPTGRDVAVLNATVARWGEGGEAEYQDLFIALMNTTEFVNRH